YTLQTTDFAQQRKESSHADQTGVAVILVNYNAGAALADCLADVFAQTAQPDQVVVVDNASHDGSLVALSEFPEVRLQRNPVNRGFAQALNQGIQMTDGEFVLVLNPDVQLSPNFLAEALAAIRADDCIGSVAGKLLQPGTDPPRFDSTGLFLDRRRQTCDRGQGRVDRGQYDQPEEVFAATGAAALYRRAMLNDVAVEGEVFDEDFWLYYEDIDLGWRAQLRGWRCRYVPTAIGWHVRSAADRVRRAPPGGINRIAQRHALKNRYLMLLKNDTVADLVRDWPWIIGRDLPRLTYLAFRSPWVLAGLADAWRLRQRMWCKRRVIQSRRTVPPARIRRWLMMQV
ncbi:MAG TPA: glycosyltransferase family 2 protein, partial [Anaerolineae bacterium]|nr:glycosyltransferase family 2 protein [Anaerolineae bacterium]